MNTPPAKRPRKRGNRSAVLLAIGVGLGGGLLLAAPLSHLLAGQVLGPDRRITNPFSAWTGLGDREVVILGTDVGGGNTDVMYTLRVKDGVTHLTQVPRDTYIDSSSFGPLKANALYAMGGPEAVKSELSKHLGRPVEHHILVNLTVIRRLGDALGGLEVDVPKAMYYVDNSQGLYIDLQPGLQNLKGRQLEGFLRFRHDEMGDIGRLERQQIALQALFRKLTRPEHLVRLPILLAAAGKDLKTDLGPMELGGLITAMGTTQLETKRLGGRPFYRDDISYWEAEWPQPVLDGSNEAESSGDGRYRFLF